jgi:hypothetical protein
MVPKPPVVQQVQTTTPPKPMPEKVIVKDFVEGK